MKWIWSRTLQSYKNSENIPDRSIIDYSVVEAQKTRLKPTKLDQFIISPSVMKETQEHLMAFGQQQKEALVFWSGKLVGNTQANITRVIIPRRTFSTAVYATVSSQELQRIRKILKENNEFLFVQVHSHPGEAFHSQTDDENAISYKKGFVSIVVPSYGSGPFKDLTYCKVYEYDGGGDWKSLRFGEIRVRFVVR